MDLTKVASQIVLIPDEVTRVRFEDMEEFVVYVVSENPDIVSPAVGEYFDELALGSVITSVGDEFIILSGLIYNYEEDDPNEEQRFVFKMQSVYTFTLTPEQADNYGYRFSPIEELKRNAGFMEELNDSD